MRRIMIDASKCDGCKNCTIACMQAHWETPGTVYDLDLTDIRNESRNHIEKLPDGTYRPIFCRHCDQPECVMSCMSGALTKDPKRVTDKTPSEARVFPESRTRLNMSDLSATGFTDAMKINPFPAV